MQMYELLTPLRQKAGDPIPVGTKVSLPWDDGEALVRLGAAIRVAADPSLPVATDADREARREALLRELADVAGVHDSLQVAVVPSDAGMYLLTVTGAGVSDVQPYDPAADPLAGGDPAVIRRHHLDALRDLDDLTYLGFDEAAAADLGGYVLLSADPDTGIITSVTGRSAAPVVSEFPDDPPVAVVPADDATLAKMDKAELIGEARRVSAAFRNDMTKAELADAIRAKRVAE